MSSKLISLSDEALAAVGAKTADDFSARFAAVIGGFTASIGDYLARIKALETTIATQATALRESTTALATANASITALQTTVGNPATITEARITAIAEAAGSRTAMTAISTLGTGTPPVSAGAPAPAIGSNTPEALNRVGKYAEAFDASPELKAEFGDNEQGKKEYVAYMRANKAGAVTGA